jgi:hypothetical protein
VALMNAILVPAEQQTSPALLQTALAVACTFEAMLRA